MEGVFEGKEKIVMSIYLGFKIKLDLDGVEKVVWKKFRALRLCLASSLCKLMRGSMIRLHGDDHGIPRLLASIRLHEKQKPICQHQQSKSKNVRLIDRCTAAVHCRRPLQQIIEDDRR